MAVVSTVLATVIDGAWLMVVVASAVFGVGVSALEMSQNAERLSWTAEEVDMRLKEMMKGIYDKSVEAAERYGLGYDLIAGANIAGFEKVAQAMYEQGVF